MCSLYKDNMLMHFVEIGKHPPLFEDAAKVALEILQTPYEFDFGELYYNVFRFLLLFVTRNYSCSANDYTYFCTFLRSIVCLSVCLLSVTHVHPA